MQAAADPVHVLPHVEQDDGEAAVLADRQALGRGHLVIAYDLLEGPSSQRRCLPDGGVAQRLQDVGGDVVIGLDDQPRDRVAQLGHVDVADRPT